MGERVSAAGIMHLTRDNHALMVHRTDGTGWAFPGGRIEFGESAEGAARREHEEETEREHKGPLEHHTRRIDDQVDFTTFIARDAESFAPVLNHEHDGYQWVDRHKAIDTLELHPGAKIALIKDDLDELGIAKAIRDRELISPQRYRNLLLVAMRITGTGASYRLADDEFVWRDPSFYLNPEFLERCQGLPAIFQHPEKKEEGTTEEKLGILDGKQLSERIVGTVMLPYILGDEVWGIVKVYDETAARILEKQQLSTSPCTVFRPESSSSKYRLQDGSTLLIEGKPALLDHLAIDELGVWDKGDEPSGVLNQLEVKPMAEEAGDKAAADSNKDGTVLDKIMSRLDSMDSDHKSFRDSFTSRLDAFEFGKKDEKKDEPVKGEKKEGESAEEGEGGGPRDDKEGKPAEVGSGEDKKEVKEEPKEEGESKDEKPKKGEKTDESKPDCSTETSMPDTAKADAQELATLRARLEEMNARIPAEMPEGERLKFVAAQEKSERVCQAFGDSVAPRPMNGESLNQYRRRLISKHQKYSADWKATDLSKINDEGALAVIEDKVYADAMHAAKHPTDLPEGQLRMSTEEDETGRRTRKFYGDPEACWGPFKQPVRIVTGWTSKFN